MATVLKVKLCSKGDSLYFLPAGLAEAKAYTKLWDTLSKPFATDDARALL